jgi:conjugal transfer mating pair stabilization protein TraG
MSELIVYTYGIGEFASQVFNAVAATINNDSFKDVLKGAFLIALTLSVYRYILTKSIPDLAKNIFLYIGVTAILLMPTRNILVKDEVVGNSYSISNVPLGLAYPAHLVSTLFYGLTRLVETSFHFNDDLNYSKSGFLFASHIVRNSAQVKITDPNLNESLKSFISNCVFYDVYLGAYTFKDLLTSDNTWQLITARASANRAFDLNGKITVCKDGVDYFNRQWGETIETSLEKYAKFILPYYKDKGSDIKNKILAGVGNGYAYLTKNSQNAADILKQNILVNAINDAALENPESSMYSYAVARANSQKSVANVGTGIMMARWLPAMQGAMECMMYAMFILVAIYALFTNGEKVISNYILTLVWLASWPVVYAVMNFGFTWVIAMRSSGLGLSFYDSSALSQIQSDMASLFGYFSLSVPYFAWGLINLARQGLGSVFTQMAQLVGSSTQSYAMSSSGEAVTGNYSLGNTSFNNHSMYNTSGFKHDTNANFATGSTTSMITSGSTITTMADGTEVLNMEPGISRLNTGINFQDRMSTSMTSHADTSFSFAKGNQLSWAENMLSSVRQVEDFGTMINSSINSGDSYSLSEDWFSLFSNTLFNNFI